MPAGSQKQNLTSFIEDKTVLDMKALSVLCQQHKARGSAHRNRFKSFNHAQTVCTLDTVQILKTGSV